MSSLDSWRIVIKIQKWKEIENILIWGPGKAALRKWLQVNIVCRLPHSGTLVHFWIKKELGIDVLSSLIYQTILNYLTI